VAVSAPEELADAVGEREDERAEGGQDDGRQEYGAAPGGVGQRPGDQ
jgi:hypothetical protein